MIVSSDQTGHVRALRASFVRDPAMLILIKPSFLAVARLRRHGKLHKDEAVLAMAMVEFEEGGIQVDVAIVAKGLGIEPPLLLKAMREGNFAKKRSLNISPAIHVSVAAS